ncbi:MAG: MSMEG_0568 family radical SAM protein [Deltaproteobacteria bacterium]|nr:MSMEG_0568 family radical SAM protein [Deltaproteobacteria bacterium]
MTSSIARLITEIQSRGIRIADNLLIRAGGAGPAEAGSLVIGGFAVSVPTTSAYVAHSPYSLKTREKELFLYKNGAEVLPVQTVPRPRFYDETTEDGIILQKIALLHGTDCLATTVLQTCAYWNTNAQCRFCGIELSLVGENTIPLKTPEQLAETAARAKELDGIRHVVLTTGTATPPEDEISILIKSARAIKKKTGLPIHAQFMPLRNMKRLQDLKDSGVDTVGIHIESFDAEILKEFAPVKAAVGLTRYLKTWEQAVQLFGPNQVSSFILAGLGESPDSIISGSHLLADMGVYPFVVPLRPIPGSRMEAALPPDPKIMRSIYREVARSLSRKGLSYHQNLAGCVRCGACSALPAYEPANEKIVCHPSRTREEWEEAFSIRKAVFVEEQKLFKRTDVDEHDHKAIHLVAKHEDGIIGTVRVYRAGTGNGDWIGGRLAVKKGFRTSGAGERLVREAVATVKRKGCSYFTAHIQESNVSFFEQLGWKRIGPVKAHFGRPHQLMAANLDHKPTPHGERILENRSC